MVDAASSEWHQRLQWEPRALAAKGVSELVAVSAATDDADGFGSGRRAHP